MTSKNSNNKNNDKKSNVIYIDRNPKTGKISTKTSSDKKKQTKSKSVSKSKEEKVGTTKKKPKTLKSGTANKSSKTKQSKNTSTKMSSTSKKVTNQSKNNNSNNKKKPSKKTSKIKWGRVAIAVVLLCTLVFGGIKGIQMIKNKNSKSSIASTEKVEENSSSETNKSSSIKSQYDLNDEKNSHEKKYNIVVDAGHGGNDKGSLDSTDTIYEKDISLQIAKKVASRLGREADVNVIMTRMEDTYISLEERAEIAKRANADALISIHLNAQKKNGDANGLETWFRDGATDGSKELAISVQKTATSYVDIVSRGILRNNFEILRETTMPAVLVECGFITNVNDMKKLKDPNFQDMLAEGIMQGTLSFLDSKNGKN